MISKQEIKYIFLATIFSFLLFSIILPTLLKKNLNPIAQFFIFSIGIFVFLQVFLKAETLNMDIISISRLKRGLGLYMLTLALDIIQPPYMISLSGKLLDSAIISGGASDYFFGYIFQAMGIPPILVYIIVYIILPPLLLMGSARLLPNLVREV